MNRTPRHLLSLSGLDPGTIRALLERAAMHAGQTRGHEGTLAAVTLANLFLEPSTRTRVSFELAAYRLGADVVNFDPGRSSILKGESLLDTVLTLHAMRVELFAIRHADHGELEKLVDALGDTRLAIVCAGEGTAGHPTQGLLDALTLQQHFGGVDGLRIAIIGDIAHSRVARSAVEVLTALGAREIRIAGPQGFLPDALSGVQRVDSFDEALSGVDVVMMLRVQRERIAGTLPDTAAYHRDWGLTMARLERVAPKAMVMHPGPFNRDIEIATEVVDSGRSLILAQVANGVPIRMAVLEWLAEGLGLRA